MTLTWVSETWKAPFIPANMTTKRSRVIVFREVAGLPSVCQCRTVSVFIAITASFKEVVLLFQYLYIASTLRGEKAERWHLAKKASTRPYVHKTRPSTLTKSTEQIRSRVFVQLTYPLNNGRMMCPGAWREIRTLVREWVCADGPYGLVRGVPSAKSTLRCPGATRSSYRLQSACVSAHSPPVGNCHDGRVRRGEEAESALYIAYWVRHQLLSVSPGLSLLLRLTNKTETRIGGFLFNCGTRCPLTTELHHEVCVLFVHHSYSPVSTRKWANIPQVIVIISTNTSKDPGFKTQFKSNVSLPYRWTPTKICFTIGLSNVL